MNRFIITYAIAIATALFLTSCSVGDGSYTRTIHTQYNTDGSRVETYAHYNSGGVLLYTGSTYIAPAPKEIIHYNVDVTPDDSDYHHTNNTTIINNGTPTQRTYRSSSTSSSSSYKPSTTTSSSSSYKPSTTTSSSSSYKPSTTTSSSSSKTYTVKSYGGGGFSKGISSSSRRK